MGCNHGKDEFLFGSTDTSSFNFTLFARIQDAGLDGTSELYASLYFVAFIVSFHVLFTNVFIGIVCESYAKLSLQHTSISAMQHVLAKGVIRRAVLRFTARKRAR